MPLSLILNIELDCIDIADLHNDLQGLKSAGVVSRIDGRLLQGLSLE